MRTMLAELQLLLPFHCFLLICARGNPVTVATINEEAKQNLIYVQAIWRHGDRAPHQLPYPNDPNDESAWPRGWSQLTNIGMKQLYDLGRFFRNRYDNYIGEFNPADVRIMTSDSDRAIVSAQAMLRGLFPAHDTHLQWLDDEQWQPIPFHTESIERNAPLLHPTLYSCPRYDKMVKVEMAPIRETMMQKYAKVIQLLANVTGIGGGISFGRIGSLVDIQREMLHGLQQPAWVYRKWPQFQNMRTIDIIAEFRRVSRISAFEEPEKARLKGGLLLGDMLDRFQNVSAGLATQARKMHLYSAHDATITALQYALNVGNGLLVPYAACLIMELYRTESNGAAVKILFVNETDKAVELTVPGCSAPCPLDQLVSLTALTTIHTLDDLHEACEESQFSGSKNNVTKGDDGNSASKQHIGTTFWSLPIAMLLYTLLINC